MATITFYPEPNVASVAGQITLRADSDIAWAISRALPFATNVEFDEVSIYIQGEFVGGNYNISRSIITFDSSAIPDGATINSAVFSLYATTGGSSPETTNPANPALVGATPSNTTTFDDTDYTELGLTRYADTDVTVSDWNASTGFKSWTLNATGLAAINDTGVTILAIRGSNDFSDATAPSARSLGFGYSANRTGTTEDPKLVVDYTEGGGGISIPVVMNHLRNQGVV